MLLEGKSESYFLNPPRATPVELLILDLLEAFHPTSAQPGGTASTDKLWAVDWSGEEDSPKE